MKHFHFFWSWSFVVMAMVHAAGPVKTGCLEREQALTSLETAQDLLSKMKDTLPSCRNDLNSSDPPECGSKKSLAYIKITERLISDVIENFPICPRTLLPIDKPLGCTEILANGHKESGVYTIWPRQPFTTGKPLQVFCDMKTEGGAWTMIQRRGKYPVQRDFNLDWDNYTKGFGNPREEFWLGNENIRELCLKGCKIRFDLRDYNGVYRYAVYQKFNLSSSYRIEISDYSGNATDAMMHHNNYDFSTKDNDVSGKAKEYKSGWWHGSSYYCNLNGIFQTGEKGPKYVYWWKESDDYFNLMNVEIKVKPN